MVVTLQARRAAPVAGRLTRNPPAEANARASDASKASSLAEGDPAAAAAAAAAALPSCCAESSAADPCNSAYSAAAEVGRAERAVDGRERTEEGWADEGREGRAERDPAGVCGPELCCCCCCCAARTSAMCAAKLLGGAAAAAGGCGCCCCCCG